MRRYFILSLGLSLLFFSLQAQNQSARPNIVVILADDLGWTDLSSYGSTFYETPNLDKLAAKGVRFTQNYATCSVCSPTRASLMTGNLLCRMDIKHSSPVNGIWGKKKNTGRKTRVFRPTWVAGARDLPQVGSMIVRVVFLPPIKIHGYQMAQPENT